MCLSSAKTLLHLSFIQTIVGFKDFVNENSAPYDDDGHCTHVAGIVSGNAFSSRGKHMGITPDSNIIGVKVLGKDGWKYF